MTKGQAKLPLSIHRGNMASNSEKLDQILAKLEEIQQANATRDADTRQLKSDVADHTLTLDGNGKQGLKTEVELLKAAQKAATTWAVVLGSVLITEVAGLIFALLTHALPVMERVGSP